MARPRLHRPDWRHELAFAAGIMLTLYTLVNLSSTRYLVRGQSMYPNFDDSQVLYVSRLNYLFGEPERLDIVVFQYARNPAENYLKRVIGLPGDVVEIRNTQVYVNDQALAEPYLNEACDALRCPNRRWELGPDEYFVMGDNRNHSSDSRAFGPVQRHDIIGEVLLRYWPLEKWGIVAGIGSP